MGLDRCYRMNVMIHQVFPSSSENACSERLESWVIEEKPLRTLALLIVTIASHSLINWRFLLAFGGGSLRCFLLD
jgi:hypothetical protein